MVPLVIHQPPAPATLGHLPRSYNDPVRGSPRLERIVRAVVQPRYGTIDELEVRDVPVPEPADDELLVRVHAASVHPDVWHVVTGHPAVLRVMGSGIRRPSSPVPGTDMAGVVVDTGRDVTGFEIGDEVYGEVLRGMQWKNGGTFAEYVTAPTTVVRAKPEGLTFEEASTIGTAGLIAMENLGDGDFVWPGQRVIVNGAGGGVGMMALQIAKAHGAHVTATDAAHKVDLLRGLGADRVLDYAVQDYTSLADRFDLVFDIVGNRPPSRVRRIVKPDGRYVLIGHDRFGATGKNWIGSLGRFGLILVMSAWVKPFRITGRGEIGRSERMDRVAGLVERGAITPVVDRAFPLEQVSDALRFLSTGQPVGRVVLTIDVPSD